MGARKCAVVATVQEPNLARLTRAEKRPGVVAGSVELSGRHAWYAWSQLDKIRNLTARHHSLLGAYVRMEARKLDAGWSEERSMPTLHYCC